MKKDLKYWERQEKEANKIVKIMLGIGIIAIISTVVILSIITYDSNTYYGEVVNVRKVVKQSEYSGMMTEYDHFFEYKIKQENKSGVRTYLVKVYSDYSRGSNNYYEKPEFSIGDTISFNLGSGRGVHNIEKLLSLMG